jgi:hypothetical protein
MGLVEMDSAECMVATNSAEWRLVAMGSVPTNSVEQRLVVKGSVEMNSAQ